MATTTKKRTSRSSKKTTRRKTAGGKSSNKMVYYFGPSGSDGNGQMKQLLGGKGANLAEMTTIGLPVPPGFTITTETCAEYNEAGQKTARRA